MKRTIYVNQRFCKGCGLCIRACPNEVLTKSSELSQRGVSIPEVKNQEKCTGCHYCELVCPDFAIKVAEEPDEGG